MHMRISWTWLEMLFFCIFWGLMQIYSYIVIYSCVISDFISDLKYVIETFLQICRFWSFPILVDLQYIIWNIYLFSIKPNYRENVPKTKQQQKRMWHSMCIPGTKSSVFWWATVHRLPWHALYEYGWAIDRREGC